MNLLMLSRPRVGAGLLVALFSSNVAQAGQISLADFSSAAAVQDFQVLGNVSQHYVTPLLIGNDTFSADGNVLASSGKLGPIIGRSGTAIGNDPSRSNSPLRFIDIVPGTADLRAGLYVGFGVPWSANVQFFDTGNSLLGSILLSGSGTDSHFAGWQADTDRIGRILVIDVINNGNGIIVDDLIQEVSEPASLLPFSIGALAFIWAGRRRRTLSMCRYSFMSRRGESYGTESFSQLSTDIVVSFQHRCTTSAS